MDQTTEDPGGLPDSKYSVQPKQKIYQLNLKEKLLQDSHN
jgi:hypothetical protein